MTGNTQNLDLVFISAQTHFGNNLLNCSQYIERKCNSERNSDISQES